MKFVAVTACSTGIAHVYMAANQLEEEARKRGHTISVETQGTGTIDRIESFHIARAVAVIFAVDHDVDVHDRERFGHLPSVEVTSRQAISSAASVFDQAERVAQGKAAKVRPGVFISYRRDESAWVAVPIYDRLREQFGTERVFKDVTSIDPGDDFVEKIDESVASAAVLLVLIGRRWLTIEDDSGRRRLDDANDFVRLEVEAGLKRDIVVIPVLVDGARMPAAGSLPDGMKKLASRSALTLTPDRFDSDMYRLLKVLDQTLDADDDTAN